MAIRIHVLRCGMYVSERPSRKAEQRTHGVHGRFLPIRHYKLNSGRWYRILSVESKLQGEGLSLKKKKVVDYVYQSPTFWMWSWHPRPKKKKINLLYITIHPSLRWWTTTSQSRPLSRGWCLRWGSIIEHGDIGGGEERDRPTGHPSTLISPSSFASRLDDMDDMVARLRACERPSGR